MSRRAIILALSLIGPLAGCGARSSLGADDGGLDRDQTVDLAPLRRDLSACPGLEQMVGHYAGKYDGIVNCLEEKHLSSGTLAFDISVAADGSGELEVDGNLSETFFNGEHLTARIVGRVDCSGQSEIAISSIRVGAVLTSDVRGWLRGFVFSGSGYKGTWRMEREAPLCLAAGSWQALRQ